MAVGPSFELFEITPEGRAVPRGTASTVEETWDKLREVARKTPHECFAVHVPTRRVVGHVNVPRTQNRSAKRIFQITYDPQLGPAREDLLEHWGYRVTTVEGNDNARIALALTPPYDLFIVGHTLSLQTRDEMAAWLRIRYPKAKILAFNSAYQRIHDADYNVRLNGPETWLPIVTAVTA